MKCRAARNAGEAEGWHKWPATYYSERFSFQPIDAACIPMIDAAASQWKKNQNLVFSVMGCEPENFSDSFKKLRNALLEKDTKALDDEHAAYKGHMLKRIVWNLGWVELFCNALPQLVSAERVLEISEIGMQMAAVFYTEMLDKLITDKYKDPHVFAKLDALWQRAADFRNRGEQLSPGTLSVSQYDSLLTSLS